MGVDSTGGTGDGIRVGPGVGVDPELAGDSVAGLSDELISGPDSSGAVPPVDVEFPHEVRRKHISEATRCGV